jgi:transcriptional regulator with XRE-family HTH domain
MAKTQNIIGPQVRRLRNERDLSQDQLAAKLQLLGLEMSRAGVSKIEARLRCVSDAELPVIAQALDVELAALFPPRTTGAKKLSKRR